MADDVYISKRGRTFHADEDCPWWENARQFSLARGWTVHPTERVSEDEARRMKRTPCRICVKEKVK